MSKEMIELGDTTIRVGDRIIANYKGEQGIGTVESLDCEQAWYDIKLRVSEYKTIGVMFGDVIQVVGDGDKVYSAYALGKMGHRTFTGSGRSKDMVAESLEDAMAQTLVWLQCKHEDEGATIDWEDQPNYRHDEDRACGNMVLNSSQTITQGWADYWLSVSLVPFEHTNRA